MSYNDLMNQEILKSIRRELKIKNQLEVLKQSYEMDVIDRETYIEELRKAYNMLE